MAGMQLSINAVAPDQIGMINTIARGFSSFHPGGCHFALADGSVHFVNQSGDLATLQKLSVRDDGGGWNGNL
jgi:prepilin-type processing-associated H-X9-DG protein